MEQVPLSLPASILPSVSGVLSAGSTSQFIRVSPNNITSITSAESPAISTADNTLPTVCPFPTTPFEFVIPQGSNKNVFIDNSKSTLNFKIKIECSTASTTSYTGLSAFLQSSAHSWFERLTEKVNSLVTDDIPGWDQACHNDLAWSMNVADRDSNVLNMGLLGEGSVADSQNRTQGHAIPLLTIAASTALAVNASNTFSYSIPFKSSMLGVNARSMFPVGRAGRTEVTLYPPNIAPVTILSSTNTGGGAKVRFIMSEVYLELFYLYLDETSASLLPGPERPWSMSGVTYRCGTGSIPASTGSVSVLIPVRCKSARSLSARFIDQQVSTAGTCNGIYDSKAPLATSLSYLLNGQKRVPNIPHAPAFGISSVFNHTLQAYYDQGTDRLKSKCGWAADAFSVYIATGTAPTAANGFDQRVIAAGSTSAAGTLAGFDFAEDLRLASSSMFLNGSDMQTANSYLELTQSASSPSRANNVLFVVKADIIYVILPNGNVEVRI